MSRFANPDAKERLVLGPCECLGKPHDEDWIDLRTELGAEAFGEIEKATTVEGLTALVVGWNLLDFDGTPATVDREHVGRLFGDNFAPVTEWMGNHLRVVTALPNPSAVPSRITSDRNGSHRTRTARKAA